MVALILLSGLNKIASEAPFSTRDIGENETVISKVELDALREILQHYDPSFIEKLKVENGILLEEIARLNKEIKKVE